MCVYVCVIELSIDSLILNARRVLLTSMKIFDKTHFNGSLAPLFFSYFFLPHALNTNCINIYGLGLKPRQFAFILLVEISLNSR